ncbi:auxilin-like protein 1 isoform X2 [Prosopis cineraria]|nr:auxilin-like protein 1 isoform X2 [Prosopis cineraria]
MHSIDPSMQFPDDINLDVDLTTGKDRENHLGKTIPHPPNRISGRQTFVDDLTLHNEHGGSGSLSRETFITVSDINLRTQPSQVPPPSRPPPLLDAKKGDICDFHLNSEQVAPGGIPGDSSPPFFDVEVDMNSSAVASAATMKEAVHRVEAKLRSAKELKERKKGDFERCVKTSYGVKNNEGSRNMGRSSSLKDERIQGTSERRHSKMKIPVTDERQKTMKVFVETPDSLVKDRTLHKSEKSMEEKHINGSRSSQESDRSTGAGTWKEETDFFELVGKEESPYVFQSVNHSKSLAQDVRIRQHEWEANLQDESKMVKAIEEKSQLDEYKKKFKAAKEAYELDKIVRSKASLEDRKQKECMRKGKVRKFSEQEENENVRITHQHGKTEKKLTDVDQPRNSEYTSQAQHREVQQVKGEKSKEVDRFDEVRQVMRLEENEKKLQEVDKQRDNVKKHKQTGKMKENCGRERKAFVLGKEEGDKKQIKSMEMEENDGELNDTVVEDIRRKESSQRENEKSLKQTELVQHKEQKKAHEREENENILKDASRKEGEEGPKQALDENNGKELEEASDLELNEIRLEETVEQGKDDKRVKESYERIRNKKTFVEACEACDGCEIESGLKEADDIKGVQNVLNQGVEQDMNGRILKEAQRKEEIESPSNWEFNREGSGAISNEDSHQEHSKRVLKSLDGEERDKELGKSLEQPEGNEDGEIMKFAEEIDEILKTGCDPNHLAAQSASNHEESIQQLEELQQCLAGHVIGRTETECKVSEKKFEEVRMENLMANKKSIEPEMSPGDAEHIGTQSGKVDDCMTNDDDNDFGSQETGVEKIKTAPDQDINPRNLDRKFGHESNERRKNKQHVKIALDQEESNDKVSSSYPNLWDREGRDSEAAKSAIMLEVGNEKSTSQFHVGQSAERKENTNETLVSEERDAERMRREKELEKECLRKIDEERQREREREKDRMAVDKAMLEAEREREREKDRMAVDRATLQAPDRAIAEAREKAERAAFERASAEARQRALTEARERLEKACADARDNKANTEARLKAERAAVERATAEARERAMEKAKAERAAFESRERLERSVSDNFATSFRSGGRQGFSSSDMQDSQFQNFSSSAGSRHPYSSVHACSFSERSEGGEGESAERCRARLERYRRTAERAARALEEKNMRDLLAQKEQAERNRLAETLDAEVRRWSSGKEGNLRALLSTLQYILGPDSGWQPIPLTEVITSAAVKKAYRKATLCVHPDKLQQRGASIQHKYICEKVFDLLKEAWNKFNSEER